MNSFEALESNVRYYCRRWPAVFTSAQGSVLRDENGREYIDFFAGAGALSYGHNNPVLVDVAIEHLRSGKLLHSLDTWTPEKRHFLDTMESVILKPRQLDMVVQTVGPTGATAVEAALTLAQRLTGQRGVVGFAGGYHGMSYRAASISNSMAGREVVRHIGDFVALPYVRNVAASDIALLEETLSSTINGQGIGAIIIEPTQGEGGARPFDPAYLGEIRRVASAHGVLVIADEIQAGVGRTGPFFSFEGSQLAPDIICVSKSISGLGLPMAINLVRRELDSWTPGEFSGTFRGNNLAFATSAAMMNAYWQTEELEKQTAEHGLIVRSALEEIAATYGPTNFTVSGNGLLAGLNVHDTDLANDISRRAFDSGLVVECCGPQDVIVKMLMPLVIDRETLHEGLGRLTQAVQSAVLAR